MRKRDETKLSFPHSAWERPYGRSAAPYAPRNERRAFAKTFLRGA